MTVEKKETPMHERKCYCIIMLDSLGYAEDERVPLEGPCDCPPCTARAEQH